MDLNALKLMISVKNMIIMENVFNVLIIILWLKKVINVSKFAKVFKKVFYIKKYFILLIYKKDTYGDRYN